MSQHRYEDHAHTPLLPLPASPAVTRSWPRTKAAGARHAGSCGPSLSLCKGLEKRRKRPESFSPPLPPDRPLLLDEADRTGGRRQMGEAEGGLTRRGANGAAAALSLGEREAWLAGGGAQFVDDRRRRRAGDGRPQRPEGESWHILTAALHSQRMTRLLQEEPFF